MEILKVVDMKYLGIVYCNSLYSHIYDSASTVICYAVASVYIAIVLQQQFPTARHAPTFISPQRVTDYVSPVHSRTCASWNGTMSERGSPVLVSTHQQ